MSTPVSIVWFRQDLRLADNPALHHALKCGHPVLPVFIHSPGEEEPWQPGGASKWWLHQSLQALGETLAACGSRLIIRRGPALDVLRKLVMETGATGVFWNRRYEPAIIARDAKVKEALRGDGLDVESFNGALLHEPWEIRNKSGKPFQVFTPFWKTCMEQAGTNAPLPTPVTLNAPAKWPESESLGSLELEPKIKWDDGLRDAWIPGEAGAKKQLHAFLANALESYAAMRDRPDITGTSRLSPHLHFGEISPRQIWSGLRTLAAKRGLGETAWRGSKLLTEVGWREFSHHLLYHFPHTPTEPLRAEFRNFPWCDEPAMLHAWQRGRTGFPIVDAGMRELWATGWMHNRVRMIVASFLVKDLLLPWQEGARWFWDTLVDADLAQNTLGWQWTAGCGADAAPYFRIFNPVSQGEKFDPHGDYVRRWCPELANVATAWIHKPHAAPPEILRTASITLGREYPMPIVDHAEMRIVALDAFAQIKSTRTDG